jgi:hypothetical protein
MRKGVAFSKKTDVSVFFIFKYFLGGMDPAQKVTKKTEGINADD